MGEPALKRQRFAACTCAIISDAVEKHHVECVKKFISTTHDAKLMSFDRDALRIINTWVLRWPVP
jgi:hypothetical protein